MVEKLTDTEQRRRIILLMPAVLVCLLSLSISFEPELEGLHIKMQTRSADAYDKRVNRHPLLDLSLLNRTIIHLKENYVDPSRINERKMVGAALERVQDRVAELLASVEKDEDGLPRRVVIRVGPHAEAFELGSVTNLWQMSFKLKEIFRFVVMNLQHHDNLQEIEYAAINGLLSTLDPHSVLLRPSEYREMKLSTRGRFGGLGIVISLEDGRLTVVRPISDTPAERAGIKAGDRLTQIGRNSTVNMSLNDAVDLLRGPPDTDVELWISRKGWKIPRLFTVGRANIRVKSVRSKKLSNGIGVIKLSNFQNTTSDELRTALKRLGRKGKLRGAILDLRGNPGGLLDQAIKVADVFLDKGSIVTTVGHGARMREPKMATRVGSIDALPLIVLIDGSSASASEIVAGALKNQNRAVVIGQKSFGKGSVQVLYDNRDESALKLTVAQYLTPGDISIQSVGITPDILTKPVYIADDGTSIFGKSLSGESRLTAHLESELTAESKSARPQIQIDYLYDKPADDAARLDSDAVVVDFEVKLAADLLAKKMGPNRTDGLKSVWKSIELHKDEAFETIAKRLGEKGVVWSREVTQSRGRARLEVDVRINGQEKAAQVEAGSKLKVQVTVKNVGNAPFSRLHGVTKADTPDLDELEFILGRIEPGESRTWVNTVSLPQWVLSRDELVELSFSDSSGTAIPKTTYALHIEELSRPRFAVSYTVDDGIRGNGDGLLQRGEDADLVLTIRNMGAGESHELLGTLSNHETDAERRFFIERGRVEGGRLKPGETTSIRFEFKVKPDAAGVVPLDLSVYDGRLRAGTYEKIEFRLVEKHVKPVEGSEVVIPIASETSTRGPGLLIHAQPSAKSLVVGRFRGPTRIGARYGNWCRVDLVDGRHGWFDAAQVKLAPPQTRVDRPTVLTPRGPAVIEFDESRLTHRTKAKTIDLVGEVVADQDIKDVRVYLNQKKIFFRSSQPAKKGSARRSLGAERLLFSTRLRLESGANYIEVVTRSQTDGTATRSWFIQRHP